MEEEIVDTQKSDAQKQQEGTTDGSHEEQAVREATPGAPIIRSNTPRPFMYTTTNTIPPSQLPDNLSSQETEKAFSTLSAFPTKPPSAPPLPEEPDDYNAPEERLYTFPLSNNTSSLSHETQAFAWLFEYGLEIDSTLLNTPERLDGLALLYGPAVLKGYELLLRTYEEQGYSTRTLATIVPDIHPHAEVWGVLYRVPLHVTQQRGDEPALLETVHALPCSGIHTAMHIGVHEIYRNRTLPCITYGCTDTTALHYFSSKQSQDSLDVYVRRLTSIAKKQKLPDAYIQKLARITSTTPIPDTPSADSAQRETSPSLPIVTTVKTEQHTEPLVLPLETLEKSTSSPTTQHIAPLQSQVQRIPLKAHPHRWYVAFALYLFSILLALLSFAIIQGLGIVNDVLTANVTLFSVPWLVLMYGLLGGCISSIVTLGRNPQPIDAPTFVLITWFTRPFVGAVLALFAYLLLSSGLFVSAGVVEGRHDALFLLIGAFAGLCEGWLFLHKR